MDIELQKRMAAEAALSFVEEGTIVGVGSGSTVFYFIEALAKKHLPLEGCVASSLATEKQLKSHGLAVIPMNSVSEIPLYVDGADEIDASKYMIKGGGAALTREKLVAGISKRFVCIVDSRKRVNLLGEFPLAVEVLPVARSFVGRELLKLGGNPVYREGVTTDNGNVIIDVHGLDFSQPIRLEETLKLISGVVESGVFAKRPADVLLMADDGGVKTF